MVNSPYSLSQYIFAAHLDDSLNKNIHTCERGAIKIKKRENFKVSSFTHHFSLEKKNNGIENISYVELLLGMVNSFHYSQVTRNTLPNFSTLSSGLSAIQNSRRYDIF